MVMSSVSGQEAVPQGRVGRRLRVVSGPLRLVLLGGLLLAVFAGGYTENKWHGFLPAAVSLCGDTETTTGTTSSDNAPIVTCVDPPDYAEGVSTSQNVVVTFSESMNRAATQSAFRLRKVATTPINVSGSFSWNATSTVLTFNPTSNLLRNDRYEIVVLGTAKDAAGTPLATEFGSRFRTEGSPVVVEMIAPGYEESEVAATRNVVISFSEAMNRTATQAAFGLRKQGTTTKLAGAYSWNPDSTQMTFNPTANLLGATTYDIVVTSAHKDLQGDPAYGQSSTFSTDSTAPTLTVEPADDAALVGLGQDVVARRVDGNRRQGARPL